MINWTQAQTRIYGMIDEVKRQIKSTRPWLPFSVGIPNSRYLAEGTLTCISDDEDEDDYFDITVRVYLKDGHIKFFCGIGRGVAFVDDGIWDERLITETIDDDIWVNAALDDAQEYIFKRMAILEGLTSPLGGTVYVLNEEFDKDVGFLRLDGEKIEKDSMSRLQDRLQNHVCELDISSSAQVPVYLVSLLWQIPIAVEAYSNSVMEEEKERASAYLDGLLVTLTEKIGPVQE